MHISYERITISMIASLAFSPIYKRRQKKNSKPVRNLLPFPFKNISIWTKILNFLFIFRRRFIKGVFNEAYSTIAFKVIIKDMYAT